MWHYYVYYRIDQNDAPTLEPIVASMQARLRCQTGVTGRLLKKREEPSLWMEVYENVENAMQFEDALQRCVDRFEIEIFLGPDSVRKIECFSD